MLHLKAQTGNRVVSGAESRTYSEVNLSVPGGQTWTTDRTTTPGYFGASGTSGSYTGANDLHNVNGYIKNVSTAANQAFSFPVGSGTDLRLVNISGSRDANSSIGIAWITGDPSGNLDLTSPNSGPHSTASFGPGVSAVSTVGQWDWVDETNNAAGLTVSVSIPDMSAFGAAQHLRLVGWNGSQWVNLSGTTGTSSNAENTLLTGTMVNNITALGIGKSCAPFATLSPVGPTVDCTGDNINLTASGGVSYSWSNGATTASITVAPSSATLYMVTVTASDGCVDILSITVNQCRIDTDGDGDPDATDPSPNDACIWSASQVLAETTTTWRNADCDGDGVTNYDESVGPDGNPATTGDNTDPKDACSLNLSQVTLTATSAGDCDGDGVTNAQEINSSGPGDPRTDPLDDCQFNIAEQGTPSATWAAADCDGDGNPNGGDPNPLVSLANDDVMTAPFGTTTQHNILANDDFLANNGNTITRPVGAAGGTAQGTVAFDPITGMMSYTPTASEAGSTVTVVYNVCHGTVCDMATVNISVPAAGDSDGDGDPDNLDPSPTDPCVWASSQVLANATTTWRNADCDGDGVTNYDESVGPDGNPATTGDNTDPNDPCSMNVSQVTVTATSTGDCDGDGVTNAQEVNSNGPNDPITDPLDDCQFNIAEQGTPSATWAAADCDGDGNPNGGDPDPLSALAHDDAMTAPFGTTTQHNILANDDFLANNGNTITRPVGAAGGTAQGTVAFDPVTGIMTYSPAPSEAGTTVTVVYNVCHGTVCDLATVSITVPAAGDMDGDGDPDNLDPNPNDPCIWGASQVLANTDMTWRNADCDGDGVTNYNEAVGPDGNPATVGDNTDSNDPCSMHISQVTLTATSTDDCDGDGVTNAEEINTSGPSDPRTDPINPCQYNETEQVYANTSSIWRNLDCDNDGNQNGQDPNPLAAMANDDTFTANVGATTSFNVLTNDDFLAGPNTTITQTGGTAGGTVAFNPLTGMINYTPLASEAGTTKTVIYNVCYTVPNPDVCDMATATITIPSYCPTITNTLAENNNPSVCQGNDGSFKLCGLIPSYNNYSVSFLRNGSVQLVTGLNSNSSGCIDITGLQAGIYSQLKVIHDVACSSGSPIAGQIILVDPPSATITRGATSNPSACGVGDGFIVIQGLTTGIPYILNYMKDGVTQTPVSFTASGVNYTFIGLTSGSYTNITVTNQGCISNSIQATLSDPTTAIINIGGSGNPTLCSGNDGFITISGLASGTTYILKYMKNGINQTSISFTASGVSYSILGLTKGMYTNIRVSNEGCVSNSVMVTLNDPGAPIISLGTPNQPSACGATNGSFTVNGLNAGTLYTLRYRKDGINQTPISFVANNTAYTISGLDAGAYTHINVNQGGCISNSLNLVLQDPGPAFLAIGATVDPTICGANDASITLTGLTNGLVYTLDYVKDAVQQTSTTFTASGTTYIVQNLTAGYYTGINVTQGGCTSNTISVEINNANAPLIDSDIFDALTCDPGNDGKIIVTGLSQGVAYVLKYKKDGAQQSDISFSSISTSYVINGLLAGNYTDINVSQGGCLSNVTFGEVRLPSDMQTPALSMTSVTNECPFVFVDLTEITGTNNIGYTMTWHTSATATSANLLSDPTYVLAGTYYAAYFNSNTMCYSATTPIIVTIELCDMDEDGDPDNTDPQPNDPCFWGVGQVLANASTTWRNTDCDGDGVTNYNEVVGPDGNPLTTGDNTDPNDACSMNLSQVTLIPTSIGDCDGDGVSNVDEIISGGGSDPSTDPNDGCQYNVAEQIFSNTASKWRNEDCDGDGNTNGTDPNPLNPIANNDMMNAPFGVTTQYNILANDDFLPNDGNTIIRPTGPAGGTAQGTVVFNPTTGNMSYTPTAAEVGSTVTVVYNVCQGTVCELATVNIVVTAGDADGDGDPDNTDPQPNNSCVWGTGQVLASANITWRNNDCDGDGVTNYDEVVGPDNDPNTKFNNTDPADPCNFDLTQITLVATSTGDCDGDGVTNANEINSGGGSDPRTDPNNGCIYNVAEQVLSNASVAWGSLDCDIDGNPNGGDPNPLIANANNDAMTAPFGATTQHNILANDDFLANDGNTITRPAGISGGTALGTVTFNPVTGMMSYMPTASEVGTTVTVVYNVCQGTVCDMATVSIAVPPAGDTDGDGDPDTTDPAPNDPCIWSNGQILANATSTWRNTDCDGDGVTNYNESVGPDGNPTTMGDNTDPNDPCSMHLSQVTLTASDTGDCDGDGVTNAQEINTGGVSDPRTDPLDPCAYNEVEQVFANTTTTWRNMDCDGDGNPNGVDPNPLTPVANDDAMTAPFGATTQYNILANDDFLANDGNTITRPAGAAGGTALGTVTFNPVTGMMSYLPTAAEAGTTVTVVYNVCQGTVCDLATVVITVPPAGDTDGDGDPDTTDPTPNDPCIWSNGQILANTTTIWRNADCDGDGVTNYNESVGPDGNPATTGDNTDPKDPCSMHVSQVTLTATSTGDCDGDGVSNANEINTGGVSDPRTDPVDPCSYNALEQIFANTTTTWRNMDCDNDGNPNGGDPNPLIPLANDDAVTAPINSTSSFNILANDDFLANDGNTITRPAGAAGGTAQGTVTFDPVTGMMTYLPTAAEAGTTVTVVYEVCQGTVCDQAEVTINVTSSCVTPVLKVLLEGPYMDNGSTGIMTTKLYNLGYLPGQQPSTFFGIPTPAGQPYNGVPWNYNGTEGNGFTTALGPKAGYPNTTTDWVLVSLREGTASNTTVCTRAALLLRDGTVQMVSGFDCCGVDVAKTYYVVVEHRNHLLVMSHQKVAVVNNAITYDFTLTQSFKGLLGFGQKLLNGKYVMYAGNGQQGISSSADTDINVTDKDLWLIQNGQNSSYYKNDFELNGDVNVQDKNLWLINNGKFSDVPRN